MRDESFIREELRVAEKYIGEHWDRRLTWDEIGAMVELSGDYLARLYQKTYRKTLHENVSEYRLAKAAELLVETNRPVKEIGYETLLVSPSRFGKVFRDYFGVSPTAYRRLHREASLEGKEMP